MAINFPSTAGQPTNGSYTYTVAGISYSWNGESWVAAGAGASATYRTLFSVSTNAASATPALSYNNNSGVFSYTPPDISDMATQTWVGTQGFLTATPQIVQGNSKAEVIGVGSNDGEFKVTLQDNTSGGAGAEALKLYQPSASSTTLELFEGNKANTASLNLNSAYGSNGSIRINFKSSGGSSTTGTIYYSVVTKSFEIRQNSGASMLQISEGINGGAGSLITSKVFFPDSDNTLECGTANRRWSEVHAVNFYGDGSGLTNVTSGASRTTVSATNLSLIHI